MAAIRLFHAQTTKVLLSGECTCNVCSAHNALSCRSVYYFLIHGTFAFVTPNVSFVGDFKHSVTQRVVLGAKRH